jgi:hypothetical protein
VWLALTFLLAWSAIARAQATWEYTPYQVRLVVALTPAPQLSSDLTVSIGESVAARADAVFGAVWSLTTSAAESQLRSEMLAGMASLTAEKVVAAVPPAELGADKLYLARIHWHNETFRVGVRELDCRTRQLGTLVERTAASRSELASGLWDAVVECFAPLARIELVDDTHITARLRSAGLVTDPASPLLVEPGMVLRPIVRRNDRGGQPAKGGIQPLPWTVLAVNERRESVLECTLFSGYRTSVPARGGLRVERLALLIRPTRDSTRLVLRARDKPEKALAGYEIYTRALGSDEPHLAGRSDVEGGIELTRGNGPLQMVFVRNGKQLLARLPIVVGEEVTVEALIPDDDRRLEAEAYVAALSSRALDLVARREIMVARFRARLKEGKVNEAQQLLDDFRKLETSSDLNRELELYKQRATVEDRTTRRRVEALFVDAQKLLRAAPLSDELLGRLTRELAAAQAGSK